MQVNTRYLNSTGGTSSDPPHEDDVFRYLNTLCLLTCLVIVTVSDSGLCCARVSSFFLHSHNKVRGLHTGITVSVCSSVHVSGLFVLTFLRFDFILLFLDFLSFVLLFLI